MRLVGQGDVAFRVQDVCLALLQDVLAEAHASGRLSWERFVMPQLQEKGVGAANWSGSLRYTLTEAESMRMA